MPDQDNLISALADRHYAHFLRAGEQLLNLDPLVEIIGAARGRVLWGRGDALEGYRVGRIYSVTLATQQLRSDWASIGFSPSDQKEGIWLLSGQRYESDGASWREPPTDAGQLAAHYDASSGNWHAMARDLNASRDVAFADRWQPTDISGDHKAAAARIAAETDMLRDAAGTLRDDPMAYLALQSTVMEKARQSTSPEWAERCIGALFSPQYLPAAIGRHFHVSPFGGLGNPAIALYQQQALETQGGGRTAQLYPPYERVGRQTSGALDSRVVSAARGRSATSAGSATSRRTPRRGTQPTVPGQTAGL